jgi:hypothetical protein
VPGILFAMGGERVAQYILSGICWATQPLTWLLGGRCTLVIGSLRGGSDMFERLHDTTTPMEPSVWKITGNFSF